MCDADGMLAPTWRRLPRPAFDVDTEAPCGTSVAEAREALAFWRGRLRRLPWYRRAARAEAREMAARWQRRMLHAQLERWRLHRVAEPLLALFERTATSGAAARHLAKRAVQVSPIARVVAVAAVAVTAASLAVLALVVVAIAQLV
jgi:hypothetical protein